VQVSGNRHSHQLILGQQMKHMELRNRTKQFASRIIRMFMSMPKTRATDVLGFQCLKSGTSVAANFREASRARSKAEFLSKLGVVETELDETLLWLELIVESKLIAANRMTPLLTEADELLRIVVTIIKNTKRGRD
jgi:four helix bundle protein